MSGGKHRFAKGPWRKTLHGRLQKAQLKKHKINATEKAHEDTCALCTCIPLCGWPAWTDAMARQKAAPTVHFVCFLYRYRSVERHMLLDFGVYIANLFNTSLGGRWPRPGSGFQRCSQLGEIRESTLTAHAVCPPVQLWPSSWLEVPSALHVQWLTPQR